MFCCGSSWGLGAYTLREDGQEINLYGYPPKGMNPNDYCPDWECCTKEEIEAWEHAKKNWSNNGS